MTIVGYEWAMESGAKGGHKEIVELMIEKGVSDCRVAMNWSSHSGSLPIIIKTMLSAYWEKIEKKNLSQEVRDEMFEIANSVKIPISGYYYEQEFLLSALEKHREDREGPVFAFPNNFPHEIVAEIFKYLDIRSRVELIFLYSPRDLRKDELNLVEEKEWRDYVPINVRDENGLTMLHKLCYYGHRDKVDFLMKKGALKNMEDKDCKTPLWYAKQGAILEKINDKDGNRCVKVKKKVVEWIEELKGGGLR